MTYSLFLGSGPVGQLEIFTALCMVETRKGVSLERAVEQSYTIVKDLCWNEFQKGYSENPFPGYGSGVFNSSFHFERDFITFHPFSIYRAFAQAVIPKLNSPLICVEGNDDNYLRFTEIVKSLGLEKVIFPEHLRLPGSEFGGYQISDRLLPISKIIWERGYPRFIAGAHFLTISQHWNIQIVDGKKVYTQIPYAPIVSLMDNETEVFFLEEGALVNKEEEELAKWRDKMRIGNHSSNFEGDAALIANLIDQKRRLFEFMVYPYNYRLRDLIEDEQQVLVSVRIQR